MAVTLSSKIAALTLDDYEVYFSPQTRARAKRYAEDGHVLDISEDSGEITAHVLGNGHTYQVVIEDTDPLLAYCSCPVAQYCKHILATLLICAENCADRSWRTLLTRVLHQAQSTPKTRGLGLILGRNPENGKITGVLYPAQRNLNGEWSRRSTAWSTIAPRYGSRANTDGFDPLQLSALRNLYEAARRNPYSNPNISLRDLGTAAMAYLRNVHDAGVELYCGDVDQPLRLAHDPWGVQLSLSAREPDSNDLLLRVLPETPNGTPAEVLAGTTPPLALSYEDGAYILGRLRSTIPDYLFQAAEDAHPLTIPAADVPVFELNLLPELPEDIPVVSPDGAFTPHRFAEPNLHALIRRPSAEDGAHYRHSAFLLEWYLGRRMLPADGSENPAESEDPESTSLYTELTVHRLLHEAPREQLTAVREIWTKATKLPPLDLLTTQSLDLSIYQTLREVVIPAWREAGITTTVMEDADLTIVTDAPVLSTSVSEENDWLDLNITVDVGEHQIPLNVLYEALTSGHDHLILGDVLIPLGSDFDALRQLLHDAAALGTVTPESISVPRARAHALDLSALANPQALTDALTQLDHLGEPVPVPETFQGTLRSYQEAGYSWLTHLARAHYGGILADDMGLGKTAQMLAMISGARAEGKLEGPVLVVAPTSVVPVWRSEAERFTPELRVHTITGSGKRRSLALANIAASADIVVTSYTLLRLERAEYAKVDWGGVILDEAQAVKNPSTVGYHAVAALTRPWTFAVTGTPVENSLSDLAALLALTSPGLLPGHARFTEQFQNPIEKFNDEEAAALLTRLVRPFMLRRRKAEVAKDLPARTVTELSVPLAPAHAQRYRKQLERERQEILGLIDDPNANRISILASLTRLRRMAIDPGLVDGRITTPPAKTNLLLEHLQQIIPEGHRALVFSQFTTYLERIAHQLDREGITYSYLDGSTRDRAGAIAAFRDGSAPVFLISLKAGGTGLTLTEADYVYIMDPWWNPAAEEQAIDRAHRIGQDKPVTVYRLASADTIEEKVIALQARKRELAGLVDEAARGPISGADIRSLLELTGPEGR
ncbi:DEAD/DEAH box helicase [Actinotignum timonense]|nr:DEAD/DEAH box helicase [Actinotignum timonense]MDK6905627.1 DEAD/DEAH box helicase [Actinotignum timonense]